MLPRSPLWPMASAEDPAATPPLPPNVCDLLLDLMPADRTTRPTLRLVERSARDAADARARSVTLGALGAHEFAEAMASRRCRFPALRGIHFTVS